MKKMLTLLAVAIIPAMFGGCTSCCLTGLCPCCPCNWFNRTPAVVAAPAACPPTYAPGVTPQYVTPLAAPYAAAPYAAPPCAPACATWNPCQGVVTSQPLAAQQAAPCCPPQQAYAQPMMYPAQPAAYYGEPGCGYVESSCCAPMTGIVSYGPEMPVEYGPCGGGGCNSGCCDSGGMNPPVPDAYVDPRPMAE